MSKPITTRQYLTQMNMIYFSQTTVMLAFAGVVFGLVYSGKIVTGMDEVQAKTHTYALIAVVIAGFSAAHFLYQFQLSKIDKSLDLRKKMPKYLGVLLIRSSCLELPALYASVVFFLSANYYLLLIPIFSAVVFFLLRPTAASISEDLGLSEKERSQLHDPAAVISER